MDKPELYEWCRKRLVVMDEHAAHPRWSDTDKQAWRRLAERRRQWWRELEQLANFDPDRAMDQEIELGLEEVLTEDRLFKGLVRREMGEEEGRRIFGDRFFE